MNTTTEKPLKFRHPNHGEVELISQAGKESLVRLDSGEIRTVTTEWLKEVKPEVAPDADSKPQS